MNARTRYIVEAREPDGTLAPMSRFDAHPYLRSRPTFTIDQLCWWASYGDGRNTPRGPAATFQFLRDLGLPAREKTW
jgi:hypothetical protein